MSRITTLTPLRSLIASGETVSVEITERLPSYYITNTGQPIAPRVVRTLLERGELEAVDGGTTGDYPQTYGLPL